MTLIELAVYSSVALLFVGGGVFALLIHDSKNIHNEERNYEAGDSGVVFDDHRGNRIRR